MESLSKMLLQLLKSRVLKTKMKEISSLRKFQINLDPYKQIGMPLLHLLLVEIIPPIPLPLTKNKVNHINKIIMTKLSLMHPCLFSKKNQFVLRI